MFRALFWPGVRIHGSEEVGECARQDERARARLDRVGRLPAHATGRRRRRGRRRRHADVDPAAPPDFRGVLLPADSSAAEEAEGPPRDAAEREPGRRYRDHWRPGRERRQGWPWRHPTRGDRSRRQGPGHAQHAFADHAAPRAVRGRRRRRGRRGRARGRDPRGRGRGRRRRRRRGVRGPRRGRGGRRGKRTTGGEGAGADRAVPLPHSRCSVPVSGKSLSSR